MAHAAYRDREPSSCDAIERLTIDELAERLALSRSTIHYWVKDVPIPRKPPDGWPASAGRRAIARCSRSTGSCERPNTSVVLEEYVEFLQVPTSRDFVVLFLTEGHKRTRNGVSIANSDPAAVRLANVWLLQLSRNPVRYSIQYHADQSLDELRKFWGEELGIDSSAIRFQRKSNSNHLAARTWRSRYGVLTVTASDTYLRARLQAWMDCLRDEWLDSPFDGA